MILSVCVCELVNAEMSCMLYEHSRVLISYEYTHSLTQLT
jgi:hypothetical protein